MKIVTSEQMRQIEQECDKIGIPSHVLMENAGRAVAGQVRSILGAVNNQFVLCLIGPGNNGGDGLVAARYLIQFEATVSVYLCASRPNDPNLDMIRKLPVTVVEAEQDADLKRFEELLSSATCVIDALFGTGKVRPIAGIYRQALAGLISARRSTPGLTIISIDMPSGLNADTGQVDPATPRADFTVTLGLPKPGLFRFPGRDYTGQISVMDIGIPAKLTSAISTELMDRAWARGALPRRPLNANKGTFGRVLVVAGSANYVGAAYLACSGAMRAGAGLVTLAAPASIQPLVAAKLTEATYLALPESTPGAISPQGVDPLARQFDQINALLVGCGLGQDPATTRFVSSLLERDNVPLLVLDADALNTLSRTPNWWRKFTGAAILTPHPGEMARLSGKSVNEVQADRAGLTTRLADEWHKVIVLKGAHTVVASPDLRTRISPFANPGLASAGTGDVLAGAIAGFLAQGLSLFDAASLGVYIHGMAGEMVRKRLGDAGMLATDLLAEMPLAIKSVKESGGESHAADY